MTNSASAVVMALSSGVVGAVFASVIAVIASVILDRRNKMWTLRAELRRFKVTRAATATGDLRRCFFAAKTRLEYHLLAMTDIEAEFAQLSTPPKPPPGESVLRPDVDRKYWEALMSIKNRNADEIVRFNAHMLQIEAEAKAAAVILSHEFLSQKLTGSINDEVRLLSSGTTSNADSVRARIGLYEQKQPAVIRLLAEADEEVAREIRSEVDHK